MKNVKKLIAEISLYNDEIMELEQQILLQSSDKKFFAELCKEYQEKSKEKRSDLLRYQKELQEINENQELLDGRISKVTAERKAKLEKEIETLTKEVEIDNKNKDDALNSVIEISSSRLAIENNNKIKEYQQKISDNKEELQIIYNDCKEKITSIKCKIEEKENSLNDVKEQNERRRIVKELSELYDKEEKYFTVYKDIIQLIDEKQVLDIKQGAKKVEEEIDLTQEQKENLEKEEAQREIAADAKVVAENESIEDLEKNIIKETEQIIKENEKTEEQKQEERRIMEEAAKKVAEKYKDEVKESPKKDDERIFTDESRIDKEHRWMNANNAFNTKHLNIEKENEKEEQEKNEEPVQEVDEPSVVESQPEKMSFGKNVIGKIKNITKLPQHLVELMNKKINLGNVKVSAGTDDTLENQDGLTR